MKVSSRTWIAVATALALAVAATFVAAPSRAAEVNLKLVMASYGPELENYYKGLIEAFESANPEIKVELDLVAQTEINQKVRNLIQTGQTPDIVNNEEFAEEAGAGLLYRADQIIDTALLKEFIPALIDNSKYKGSAYALPDLVSARSFAWNKALLKGAKIKKAPATWPEMLAAAKAVKKKYPQIYPYCLPLGTEDAEMILTTWGGVNGGRLYDSKSNKYAINTKEFKGGLDFLQSLVNQKLTQPNPGQTDRTSGCWTLFAQGRVAMVDGAHFFPDWLSKNGGESIAVEQGAVPHAPGKTSITLSAHGYFKGYRANGHQSEIRKFLTFLFEPENYRGFLQAAGVFIPATKSGGKLFEDDPVIAPFSKLLTAAIFYPETVSSWATCKSFIAMQMSNAMSNPAKTLSYLQARCDALQKK